MQVTTTTITTEAIENFTITTFEQSISAFCDCCPNQASGTKKELENKGWYCGSKAQFCPECN